MEYIGWIIFMIALCVAAFISNVWLPIKEERERLLFQIAESETKKERAYWKKKLRILYISYVPVVRRFVLKRK